VKNVNFSPRIICEMMYFSLWIMAKPIKFITSQVSLLFNAPALLQVRRVHRQSSIFWPLNMNHPSNIHYMIIFMINIITWYLSQSGSHCLYIMTRDKTKYKASILVTSFLQSKWSCLPIIIFTIISQGFNRWSNQCLDFSPRWENMMYARKRSSEKNSSCTVSFKCFSLNIEGKKTTN
jgi:hypothetical protein